MSTHIIGTYLEKFKDWKYCPPSDHLWTVTFLLAPRNDNQKEANTFANLYNNILKVNAAHDSVYSSLWKVDVPNGAKDFVINAQDNNVGLFLINQLNFDTNNVNIYDGTSVSHSGWLSPGKTQAGRSITHKARMRFAATNWDINEIFIDKWIAAIGQQGLIEDSNLPNIKANIIITQYSCGAPTASNIRGTWIPRKKITLLKAFPFNRGDTRLEYSPSEAGDMKYNTVDFHFDAYQIQYYDIFNAGYPKAGEI
jgi:hypothetical protein